MSTNKTELFEKTPVPKAVMELSVPAMLSSLVMIVYNLADTFFVGMLGDPVQNSAVTLAAPLLLAFNAVNNLFGVGSSSMMSRALGKYDTETVKKSSAFGFWCAVFCGIVFSVLTAVFNVPLLGLLGADEITFSATKNYVFYTVTCGAVPSITAMVVAYLFRAEGSSLHASIGLTGGCLLNIILDPFFILSSEVIPFGIGMGAAGAGFATLIANCFSCGYFLILIIAKRGKTHVSISPRYFGFEKDVVSGVCGVGVPACIQNLLNVMGMTLFNNLTASAGEIAVAAMGIAQKVNQIPFHVAIGISQGTMPLIGYNFASGNIKRMKESLLFTMKTSVAFLAAVTVCYFTFSESIIGLFMKNSDIVELGSVFLRGFSFGMVFLAIDFIAVGVYQACGMGKLSLFFAIARKLVLEIPFIVLLYNSPWSVFALPYSQFLAEIILSAAAIIVLIKLFRKLENKNSDLMGI
ncbi:MAG: MATE family efflux transporter [Oscillospiraceae bacterium]|nr:MATE family efflux transporter [Oscillospiraceae bacterium]